MRRALVTVQCNVPAPSVSQRSFQVWLQGASAHQNGVPRAECPWPDHPHEARCWYDGWDAWARDGRPQPAALLETH